LLARQKARRRRRRRTFASKKLSHLWESDIVAYSQTDLAPLWREGVRGCTGDGQKKAKQKNARPRRVSMVWEPVWKDVRLLPEERVSDSLRI